MRIGNVLRPCAALPYAAPPSPPKHCVRWELPGLVLAMPLMALTTAPVERLRPKRQGKLTTFDVPSPRYEATSI